MNGLARVDENDAATITNGAVIVSLYTSGSFTTLFADLIEVCLNL